MPHIDINRRAPLSAALIVLLCMALAACGSSASTTSTAATSASAGASARTSTNGAPAGRFGQRFSALRECLQKNGITLPKRTGKSGAPGGGFLGGGAGAGPQLPKGVTQAQFAAALKKCGGNLGAGRFGGAKARLNSPAYKEALAKFGACLRQNGIDVPAPNTSGKGPIFNTSGVNTSSAKFKAAETKCVGVLRQSLHAAPGGTPGSGTSTG